MSKFFFLLLVAASAGADVASASSNFFKNDASLSPPAANGKNALIPKPRSERSPLRTAPKPALLLARGGQRQRCGGGVVVGADESLQLTTKFAVITGMVLAFNSGYVNGACLSGLLAGDGTKQASAAVTGAWTNSALGFASGNTKQFLFNAKCILSYISGSAIASLLNPNPVPFQITRGGVGPAFLIGSVLLFTSSTLAGKQDAATTDKTFLYLAAIANGMQNSITSTATSNLVRSAHFSGISSDIGTFLGQVLRGNNMNRMRLGVFCALALSFWIGGAVSYFATTEYAATSLLFSAALYLVIGASIALA